MILNFVYILFVSCKFKIGYSELVVGSDVQDNILVMMVLRKRA